VNPGAQGFEPGLEFARRSDAEDSLGRFRSEFLFPKDAKGQDVVYLAGNSLGLQPRKAKAYVEVELEDWARFGVEGHLHARHPWLPYHEELTGQVSRLVGALPHEVVVMNTLTVNLHLMMVSFYRPTKERFKIVMEAGAFPSDQYAAASQARFHGFAPEEAIVELRPRPGEDTLREEDVLEVLAREGGSVALLLLGSVNYLTGQAFNVERLTRAAHAQGAKVGFDFAHGAGNLVLRLHEWGPDFAVWCSYKYLNGGPGSLAGCFVHERHAKDASLPRFAGWWGHDKATRFQMGPVFHGIPGAEGWQLSNPPILQLAALRASLELFDEATMPKLREKSERLTGYLEYLLGRLPPGFCTQVTPRVPQERGVQLSLRLGKNPRALQKKLVDAGVVCDFREPDIIRAAPAPLYCRFEDVHRFVQVLEEYAHHV
jgi:kynureninase